MSPLTTPPSTRKDYWVSSVRKPVGTVNFQFAFSKHAPTAGSKVEMVVVSRRPAVFWGC